MQADDAKDNEKTQHLEPLDIEGLKSKFSSIRDDRKTTSPFHERKSTMI